MFTRLLTIPLKLNKSFFLFGPRGTGKTAWVKHSFPKGIYIDLLESEVYTPLLAQPSRLENLIPTDFKDWVILDEVQKIPALLNEVHRLIESKRHKFVLTGSSARGLRKKGVNLLAGRALTFHMYPLTCEELKERFSLEQSLLWGHLPSIFSEWIPKGILIHTLKLIYVKKYCRKD